MINTAAERQRRTLSFSLFISSLSLSSSPGSAAAASRSCDSAKHSYQCSRQKNYNKDDAQFVEMQDLLLLDVNGVSVVDAAGVAIPGSISSMVGIYKLMNLAVRLDVEMRGHEVTRIVASKGVDVTRYTATIGRMRYQAGL
jgi:hypothetical protein